VRAGLGQYLSWVDENRAAARFVWRRRETEVVGGNWAEIGALTGQTEELIEAWRRPLVEARQLRDLSLPVLQAVWFGPAEHYARRAVDGGRPLPLLESERALGGAAWAALRPKSSR
jgi:hypothetical protein